ncbi:hypothetical protein LguiB_003248 [Lonicera macranthoides]
MELGVRENEVGERRIRHYSSSHKILLVGEGDFSFAACLARVFGSAVNMVATSLDPESSLRKEYKSAATNLERLKEWGCTIIHGVDALTMSQHTILSTQLFDRIVFNFPHAGFFMPEHTDHQIQLHQSVVRGFLKSAREMLTRDGEVHVTHKTAHPFSKWEIEVLATEAGLRLVEKAEFALSEYPGYLNKRGHGNRIDMTFPVGASTTYKFATY